MGHEFFFCVRDKSRFELTSRHERFRTIEVNFLVEDRPPNFPRKVDVAFYLIHSMNSTIGNFAEEERRAAVNFMQFLEARLEFKIVSTPAGDQLVQTATFRPRGVSDRLYWYAVLPLHGFIFNGMISGITK